MGGGGKSGTSTSTVKIPKEVLARYNAVNTRAEAAASQPFQQYGGQFVAGINPTQRAGIDATGRAAGVGQGYFDQAGSLMRGGAGAVRPGELNIDKYLSPYTENVVNATQRTQQQQNQQQAQQLAGNAISQGAFGGDRAGIAQANLAGQQSLANQQTLAGLRQQGYTQALGAAQQQQGLGYQANVGNLARQMQAGQGLAGLGAQAQTSALQGAQAQIGAGTLEQQTQQAGLSALYNQFLQQQGFPYQQAQFLAGIAEGTGALSGSTTTNTQPTSFFSDERLKEDIKPIGKTFDGQPIYSYRMKGDSRTQIGLLAQEVEHHHPEAVGLARGYKTVDYDKATEHAAHRGHFYQGGLASSAGGGVGYGNAGEGFADGGVPIGGDIQQILAAQKAMYPYQQAGMYGMQQGTGPHGIAMPQQDIAGLAKAFQSRIAEPPSQRSGGLGDALNTASSITNLYKGGKDIYNDVKSPSSTTTQDLVGKTKAADMAAMESGINNTPKTYYSNEARGGLVRPHYDMGGAMPYGQAQGSPLDDVLKEQKQEAPTAPKSATPPSAGPSGAQQALQSGAQLASIAALFLNRGGAVHGYASGGLAGRNSYGEGGVGTPVEDPRDPVLEAAQRALERIPLPRAGAPAAGANQTNRIPQSELPSFARPTGGLRVDQPVVDTVGGLLGGNTPRPVAPAQPGGTSARLDLTAPGAPASYGPRSTDPAAGDAVRGLVPRTRDDEAYRKLEDLGADIQNSQFVRDHTPDPRSPLAKTYDYLARIAGPAKNVYDAVGNATMEGANYLVRSPEAGEAGLARATDRLASSARTLGQASGLFGEPSPVSPAAREPAVAPSTAPAAVPAAPAGGLAPPAPPATASAAPKTIAEINQQRENPNGPIDLVHPGGTAAGIYGINKPTWAGIIKENPDAGLMPYDALFGENKQNVPAVVSTAQQRLAHDLLQQSNGNLLKNAGLPVNNETLSSAHRLGAPTAIALNQAPKDMPIEEFFAGLPGNYSDKVSIIQQMPGVKTVGDALAQQAKYWMNGSPAATGLAPASRPDAAPSVSPTLDKLQQATLGTPAVAPEAKAPPAPQPSTEAKTATTASAGATGQSGLPNQNWLDRNQSWLVPLLSGLGTMASSDSRYLGSAILQGIGGAAASYPEMQRLQAGTEAKQLENQAKYLDLAKSDFFMNTGNVPSVYLPGGGILTKAEWMARGRPPTLHQAQLATSLGYDASELKDAGDPFANLSGLAPTSESSPIALGQSGIDQIRRNAQNYASSGRSPEDIANSQKVYDSYQRDATLSSDIQRQTRILSSDIARLSAGDVGAISGYKTNITKLYNGIINNIAQYTGMSSQDRAKYTIGENEIGTRDAATKLSLALALNNVSDADQNSLQALRTTVEATPGPDMARASAIPMLAKLMVDRQLPIDRAAYARSQLDQARNLGGIQALNMNDTDASFRNDHTEAARSNATIALTRLMMDRPELFESFINGEVEPREIDKAFERMGLYNMSRIFTGSVQ